MSTGVTEDGHVNNEDRQMEDGEEQAGDTEDANEATEEPADDTEDANEATDDEGQSGGDSEEHWSEDDYTVDKETHTDSDSDDEAGSGSESEDDHKSNEVNTPHRSDDELLASVRL